MDARKEQAITGLIAGEAITVVSKAVGVSRTAIYSWLGDAEFRQEMEHRRKIIIEEGNNYLSGKLLDHLKELHNLAMNSTDKRTKATVLMYLVDRSLGKSNKIDVVEDPLNHPSTLIEMQELFATMRKINGVDLEGSKNK